jgi:Nucleotide modification associated domain 3
MKIILSRKGFDSSDGNVASPIFPSGELCTLPIPDLGPDSTANIHSKRYAEIKFGNWSLGTIVNDLTRGKITGDAKAHLDPDINFDSIAREANWKPVFGQSGAAERHLQNYDVKEGDVFVFYGWFRQIELCAGIYRYVRGAPDLHVIFGWLQIERRISVDKRSEIPSWALYHQHCNPKRTEVKYNELDSIYIATDEMKLPNITTNKPGAGVFQRFNPALCLTAPGRSRSRWQLPSWFYPEAKKAVLSYHRDLKRWTPEEGHVLLQSVGRGQEFVLDCEEYPEAVHWLSTLLCL